MHFTAGFGSFLAGQYEAFGKGFDLFSEFFVKVPNVRVEVTVVMLVHLREMERIQALSDATRGDADEAPVDVQTPLGNGDGRLEALEYIEIAPKGSLVEFLQSIHVCFHDGI